MLPAEVLDGDPRLGLAQEADNLCLTEPLLRRPNPFGWGSDSTPPRYSFRGGRHYDEGLGGEFFDVVAHTIDLLC